MSNEEERIPDVYLRSLKSQYEEVKGRVDIDSELSEVLDVKVGMPSRICAVIFLQL